MKKIAFSVLALAAASQASAGVYVLNYAIGAGSVTGSITTDGTLGVLNTGSILAFDLLLDDSASTIEITKNNAQEYIYGSSLTATSGGLFFDFSGSGFALFQAPNTGSGIDFFCLQANSCYNSTPGAAVDVNSGFPGQTAALSGNQQFATAAESAVPEPAAWAMMVGGFALTGAAMRRKKAAVSFA